MFAVLKKFQLLIPSVLHFAKTNHHRIFCLVYFFHSSSLFFVVILRSSPKSLRLQIGWASFNWKKRSIKTWSETIEFWAEQGDLKNEFSFILIKQKKKEFCTKTRNETQQNHPRNPPEQVKTVRKWMEELVFLGCFASPFVCLRSQDCCVWWLEEKVLHRCTIGWFLTYVCVGGPNYLRRWMSTDLFLLPRLLFDWEELEEFFSEIVSRSCHKIS